MFWVLECVWTQHDQSILWLAAAIWVVGSLAFFLALERIQECSADRYPFWVAVGGVAGGLGVWATHFVAMLAYKGGLPIGFAFAPTFVSALIAIVGFWLALQILKSFTVLRCLAAGLVATFSVGVMHFIGMAAIQVQARVSYDWHAVAVSAVTAAALFVAAFLAFGRLASGWRVGAAAAASVGAVFAVHFTGMAATVLEYDPTLPLVEISEGRHWLIGAIVGSTLIVIMLTAAATMVDRFLTDLEGLSRATLEGLLIVKDNKILEANARFCEMIGQEPSAIIGLDPETLLAAVDGQPIAVVRDQPVEAAPRDDQEGRVFEVAVHEIEYRGRASQVLAVRDLTEARMAHRQIAYLARHDGLTGLPNRTLLQERLDHALTLCARAEESLALLALDLDRFKAVNDIFGHAAGDRVLQNVAQILKQCVRASDTVARIGGDEFIILQVGASQPDGAHALAHRILESFRREMNPAQDPTAVGVSIGVAVYPQDGGDAASLHNAADIALYRAKTTGRGTVAFFDAEMDVEVRRRRQLESELRHAITRGELHLVYQPLIDTADGQPSGYEALLRWRHPERGNVPPDVFIPIAEETGAILAIGEWVLRQACCDAAGWEKPLTLAVNISAVQLQVSTLEESLRTALRESGLAPERLELEVTETALMKDRDEAMRTLLAIKKMGVRIAMDDFGTGYSSLSNLQSFPFDKIKIDRSFIQAMVEDNAARSIIRAIVGIGRSLALPVVAEGIETEEQHRMVVEEGCPMAQGYLYGMPGPGPAAKVGLAVPVGC